MEEAQRRGGWPRETWLSGQGMSQHRQHPETRTRGTDDGIHGQEEGEGGRWKC